MHHSGTELINPFKLLEHVGIQPGWQVADLGCGALGHFVFPAAQFVGGNGKVFAVDIDKAALKAVERAARFDQIWNLHPVWSDIEVVGATCIPPESLDLTLIINNLFLSQNKAGLVAEAFRLTKPGGLILLVEWKKEMKIVIGPSREMRMTREEAQQIMAHPELEQIDQFEAGDSHFAMLFRKFEHCHEPHVITMNGPEA